MSSRRLAGDFDCLEDVIDRAMRSGWRVEIRKPGQQAWAIASAERFLTLARARREARVWREMGFEVQMRWADAT